MTNEQNKIDNLLDRVNGMRKTIADAADQEANNGMSEAMAAEQAFEMRAAFGPGATVVNVITGERFTT